MTCAGADADENFCCGCSACAGVCPKHAIVMKADEKGFYIPLIDENVCINCGQCIAVCPLTTHAVQGPKRVGTVYAIQIKDKLKRMISQSGGAYRALADRILELGGVLYGVVSEENRAAYRRVDSQEETERLCGSKYVQAYVGDKIMPQICADLISGKNVLFSGTPCHIAGLKKYLERKKVNTDKLFTVDLICHGVPSPYIYEEYLHILRRKHETEISKFNFRDNVFGWGTHVCSYEIGTDRRQKAFSENYVRVFYSGLCLNHICYECPYASMERVGDLTVGDCWGVEESMPEWNDLFGTSMVLINTKKGQELFKEAGPDIIFRETVINYERQPNLRRPSPKPKEYDLFWKLYRKEGLLKAAAEYCGYREDEDFLLEILGFYGYQKMWEFIREKNFQSVYLYGIGMTMWQMIYCLENEKEKIEIAGLLDRDKAYRSRTFMGYQVADEDELPGKNYAVIICSKKRDVIAEIINRLKSNRKYNGASFIHIYGTAAERWDAN